MFIFVPVMTTEEEIQLIDVNLLTTNIAAVDSTSFVYEQFDWTQSSNYFNTVQLIEEKESYNFIKSIKIIK